MASPRLFRPAARLLSSRLSIAATRPAFRQTACAPSILRYRGYATESGTKEVTVRDALNEALAEELESNKKTFILGEEVAQYNGAYGFTSLTTIID
jgi:pyruvate dehydrogenase E1 component beta subunit